MRHEAKIIIFMYYSLRPKLMIGGIARKVFSSVNIGKSEKNVYKVIGQIEH